MNIRNKYLLLFGCIYLTSCNNTPKGSHGPIRLGDSSTIVTESDPQRLQDLVTDLNPVIPSNIPVDSPKPKEPEHVADTAKKTPAPAAEATLAGLSGPGMKAEFKETVITLPGINAKQAGKSNPNGAVFTWVGGNINNSVLHATGNVTKVSQRYQSVVLVKGRNGDLPLEELSNTTSWKQINGNNGAYSVKGLGDNELDFENASAGEIKNAINKSARTRRLSHKKLEEWLNIAGKNPKIGQKPVIVTLRSVMWKIDGKDEKGKIFSKQIRIDIPM